MNCMSCGADVEENEAQFVLGVFLCPGCGEVGQMLRDHALLGLETVMATLDERVRKALTDKRFPMKDRKARFRDNLSALTFLLATREPWPASLDSMKPHALTAGGSESSEKPRAAD